MFRLRVSAARKASSADELCSKSPLFSTQSKSDQFKDRLTKSVITIGTVIGGRHATSQQYQHHEVEALGKYRAKHPKPNVRQLSMKYLSSGQDRSKCANYRQRKNATQSTKRSRQSPSRSHQSSSYRKCAGNSKEKGKIAVSSPAVLMAMAEPKRSDVVKPDPSLTMKVTNGVIGGALGADNWDIEAAEEEVPLNDLDSSDPTQQAPGATRGSSDRIKPGILGFIKRNRITIGVSIGAAVLLGIIFFTPPWRPLLDNQSITSQTANTTRAMVDNMLATTTRSISEVSDDAKKLFSTASANTTRAMVDNMLATTTRSISEVSDDAKKLFSTASDNTTSAAVDDVL